MAAFRVKNCLDSEGLISFLHLKIEKILQGGELVPLVQRMF